MKNNNCDGGTNEDCSSNPEVRVLPTGGDSNGILCWRCFQHEMEFRRDRNKDLSKDCQFDLPPWGSLKVYNPGE